MLYLAPTCASHTFACGCKVQRLSLVPPRSRSSCSHTMAQTSTDDSVSVFRDGKLKPGIYKIQNIVGQTYLDIREHTKELCCRPVTVLEGKGLVGSSPHLIPVAIVIVTFSGKFSLRVPDIPYEGCGVEWRFSLARTERRNTARTRPT
jgi:hypothetical protein